VPPYRQLAVCRERERERERARARYVNICPSPSHGCRLHLVPNSHAYTCIQREGGRGRETGGERAHACARASERASVVRYCVDMDSTYLRDDTSCVGRIRMSTCACVIHMCDPSVHMRTVCTISRVDMYILYYTLLQNM